MTYSLLGKTGLRIPPVIFGTSALGNLYEQLSDNTKLEIVRLCLENTPSPLVFDIAGKYGAGLALEQLGRCLHQLGVNPNDVIISNKLGWLRTPLTTPEPTFEPGGVWVNLEHDAVQNISYQGIIDCWEQGNELLGYGYKPRLVSVHDPDEYLALAITPEERHKRYTDILEAYRALADLKACGKVQAIGVGAKNWRVIREISREVALDWVMFANSFTIMRHDAELLEFMDILYQNGVGIINSAVFHAGFLTGGKFFDYKQIQPDTPENKAIYQWREDFWSVCQQFDVSPAVACIQFGLTPPGVCCISLNTSVPEHVHKNIKSVQEYINPDFWHAMKSKGLIRADYPYLA